MKFRPFRAIRPRDGEAAARVAALPYDVMTAAEARAMVADKPDSFLHVDKAEIDLDPAIDPYSDQVYQQAAANLADLQRRGRLIRDPQPTYYLYQLTMDGRTQTGLVGCASVDDYLDGAIKKHELTRADKEEDRVRHVDTLNANTGPIFLAQRPDPDLDTLVQAWLANHPPVYDFMADSGVRHTVFRVGDPATVERITALFQQVPALYIADGHHRCASAVRVAGLRRDAHPGYGGDEEFNFFLAVVFPSNQLHIMDYNRVVADLNGLSVPGFLAAARERFDVTVPDDAQAPFRPTAPHQFGLYVDGTWSALTAKPGWIDEADPVGRLDAIVLQDGLLGPVLGIGDPRTDKRIDFVGGIRGLAELSRRVDTAGDGAAFALTPVRMDDLLAVADAGRIMPPKSTWFEPKLLSGLFIHELA
ncbi:MAG: DUF1015 family protein [Bifidobacteriaceae bacterium]|nr:DUF1015 family protein [Bifidobacteriaceae bacterium]